MRSARRKALRAKRHRGRRLYKYGDPDVLDYQGEPAAVSPTPRRGGYESMSRLSAAEGAKPGGPEVLLTLGGEPVVVQVKPEPAGRPYGADESVYAPMLASGDLDERSVMAGHNPEPQAPQSRRRWFQFSLPGFTKRVRPQPVEASGKYSMASFRRVAGRPFSWRKFGLSAGLSSGVGSLALLLMHWVGG